MARHNEVTLYGQIIQAPRIMRAGNQEDGPLIRVMCPIAVIRGIRSFGTISSRPRLDLPILLSQNENIMNAMAEWEVGDMILVRGMVTTADLTKKIKCPYCGHIEMLPSQINYVNPVYVKKEYSKLSSEEGNLEMRENAEISNRALLLGQVCNDLQSFRNNGVMIVNYQLEVQRKFRIREDDEDNHYDFPFIKSYGYIAENDMIAIKRGATVFVDGALQTREYDRTHECAACHESYNYRETILEVVPYSTEYLDGCLSMEEVDAIRQDEETKKFAMNELAENASGATA